MAEGSRWLLFLLGWVNAVGDSTLNEPRVFTSATPSWRRCPGLPAERPRSACGRPPAGPRPGSGSPADAAGPPGSGSPSGSRWPPGRRTGPGTGRRVTMVVPAVHLHPLRSADSGDPNLNLFPDTLDKMGLCSLGLHQFFQLDDLRFFPEMPEDQRVTVNNLL